MNFFEGEMKVSPAVIPVIALQLVNRYFFGFCSSIVSTKQLSLSPKSQTHHFGLTGKCSTEMRVCSGIFSQSPVVSSWHFLHSFSELLAFVGVAWLVIFSVFVRDGQRLRNWIKRYSQA